jgi:hypothetical protein
VLRLLSLFGLVWDLKPVPASLVRAPRPPRAEG